MADPAVKIEMDDDGNEDILPGTEAHEQWQAAQDAKVLKGTETVEAPEDGEKTEQKTDSVGEGDTAKKAEDAGAAADATPDGDVGSGEEDDASAGSAGKDHLIPKSRLDQVTAKLRGKEEELEQLRSDTDRRLAYLEGKAGVPPGEGAKQSGSEAQAPPEFDFQANAEAEVKALLDSDIPQVAALRKEASDASRALAQYDIQQGLTKADSSQDERFEFQTKVNQLEQKYPQLEGGNEQLDQDAVETVTSLVKGFVASGQYKAPEALEKAVGLVASANGWDAKGTGLSDTLQTTDAKRVDQAKAKAAKASKQPPSLTSVGTSNAEEGGLTAQVAADMPEDEFDKLPEKQLAVLRGDSV